MPLAGKVCLITGASRGIGKAIAERFAAEGARLMLLAQKQAPELPAGAQGLGVRCDVSDERAVAAAVAQAQAALGSIDVAVLNAGVLERAGLAEMSAAQWDRVLNINLRGAFLCARAVWPAMLQRRQGRIVAIGSISGTLGTPQASAYNASKWGLTGFIKSIAEEGREAGLLCVTVLPGGVDTDMLRQTPFAPQMKPEAVANVVAYLAGEAPLAMTGSAVEVFG